MHGKVFEMSVPFGTHSHCYKVRRCSETFLAAKKYTAFSDGNIKLDDTISYKVAPEWGVVRFAKLLLSYFPQPTHATSPPRLRGQ
jgi:hypothetical protein